MRWMRCAAQFRCWSNSFLPGDRWKGLSKRSRLPGASRTATPVSRPTHVESGSDRVEEAASFSARCGVDARAVANLQSASVQPARTKKRRLTQRQFDVTFVVSGFSVHQIWKIFAVTGRIGRANPIPRCTQRPLRVVGGAKRYQRCITLRLLFAANTSLKGRFLQI